jgi:hypothetical protein
MFATEDYPSDDEFDMDDALIAESERIEAEYAANNGEGGNVRGGSSSSSSSSSSGKEAKVKLPDPCEKCKSSKVDKNYFAAFKVSVCWACQKAHESEYGLLTKGRAKSEYLLTDKDMRDWVFWEKQKKEKVLENGAVDSSDKSRSWRNSMKLYRVADCLALAMSRHGSEEDLAEAVKKKGIASLENKLKRARSKQEREKKKNDLPTARPMKYKRQARHVCKYEDVPKESLERCKGCGMERKYESF